MFNICSILFTLVAMASLPWVDQCVKIPSRQLTERETWWRDIEPSPDQLFRINKVVDLYATTQSRYKAVEGARKPGCPAPVVFVFHMRESTNSFSKHLHEGSSLKGRTRWVPKGRPLKGSPPFTWDESAIDALYILKNYQAPEKWATIDSMVDWIERYNGLGYRLYHDMPSPYVVAGSNLQVAGKYTSDHGFDKKAWDRQLGCLIVLKLLDERGHWDAPPYNPRDL